MCTKHISIHTDLADGKFLNITYNYQGLIRASSYNSLQLLKDWVTFTENNRPAPVEVDTIMHEPLFWNKHATKSEAPTEWEKYLTHPPPHPRLR